MNNQYKYVDKTGNITVLGFWAAFTAITAGATAIANAIQSVTGGSKKNDKGNNKDKDKGQDKTKDTTDGSDGGKSADTTPKQTTDLSTNGKEKAATSDKNKPTNKGKPKVEKQTCPESTSNKALDILQFIIDVIGFFPVAGDICDAINALIYFARNKLMDAVISVGSIVFSVIADTVLKPLKWAAGTAIDIAKKILDKIPSFPKEAISFVKSLPGKIKQIPLVRKRV